MFPPGGEGSGADGAYSTLTSYSTTFVVYKILPQMKSETSLYAPKYSIEQWDKSESYNLFVSRATWVRNGAAPRRRGISSESNTPPPPFYVFV